MTIRITKRGSHPNLDPMIGTCTCGTEIECERGDTTVSCDQRDPGRYVKCPVCKKTIWVEEKEG